MTTQRRTATTQTARAKAKSRSARNETTATAAAVTSPEAAALPAGEKAVLKVFRTYLMTPRKMLCLGKPEVETHRAALAQLLSKGFLVRENFQGGYSLTEAGFAAMKGSA